MTGLFCIANLLEVGRKKTFLKISFGPLQTKMEYNIPRINVLNEMALKLARSKKVKKK